MLIGVFFFTIPTSLPRYLFYASLFLFEEAIFCSLVKFSKTKEELLALPFS